MAKRKPRDRNKPFVFPGGKKMKEIKLKNLLRKGKIDSQVREGENNWFEVAGRIYKNLFDGDEVAAQRMAWELSRANEGVIKLKPGIRLRLPMPRDITKGGRAGYIPIGAGGLQYYGDAGQGTVEQGLTGTSVAADKADVSAAAKQQGGTGTYTGSVAALTGANMVQAPPPAPLDARQRALAREQRSSFLKRGVGVVPAVRTQGQQAAFATRDALGNAYPVQSQARWEQSGLPQAWKSVSDVFGSAGQGLANIGQALGIQMPTPAATPPTVATQQARPTAAVTGAGTTPRTTRRGRGYHGANYMMTGQNLVEKAGAPLSVGVMTSVNHKLRLLEKGQFNVPGVTDYFTSAEVAYIANTNPALLPKFATEDDSIADINSSPYILTDQGALVANPKVGDVGAVSATGASFPFHQVNWNLSGQAIYKANRQFEPGTGQENPYGGYFGAGSSQGGGGGGGGGGGRGGSAQRGYGGGYYGQPYRDQQNGRGAYSNTMRNLQGLWAGGVTWRR